MAKPTRHPWDPGARGVVRVGSRDRLCRVYGHHGKPTQRDQRVLRLLSAAHLVSHFHQLVLPPGFFLLRERMGVGYVQLGIAVTVYNVMPALAEAPMGYAVDRFGPRRMLIAGLSLSLSLCPA